MDMDRTTVLVELEASSDSDQKVILVFCKEVLAYLGLSIKVKNAKEAHSERFL